MLINNKISRLAFFEFLEMFYPGKDQLLSVFLVLEGIRKESKTKLILSKKKMVDMVNDIEQLRAKCGIEKETIEGQIFLITEGLRDAVSAVSVDEDALHRRITQAQEEIILLITPFYDDFLESSHFRDFELTLLEKERKSYADKSCESSFRTGRSESNNTSLRNMNNPTATKPVCLQRKELTRENTITTIAVAAPYENLSTICFSNDPSP